MSFLILLNLWITQNLQIQRILSRIAKAFAFFVDFDQRSERWRSIKRSEKVTIRGWRPSTTTPSSSLKELLLFTRELSLSFSFILHLVIIFLRLLYSLPSSDSFSLKCASLFCCWRFKLSGCDLALMKIPLFNVDRYFDLS